MREWKTQFASTLFKKFTNECYTRMNKYVYFTENIHKRYRHEIHYPSFSQRFLPQRMNSGFTVSVEHCLSWRTDNRLVVHEIPTFYKTTRFVTIKLTSVREAVSSNLSWITACTEWLPHAFPYLHENDETQSSKSRDHLLSNHCPFHLTL
jgi:hypothetical protein